MGVFSYNIFCVMDKKYFIIACASTAGTGARKAVFARRSNLVLDWGLLRR
jgi:hypothetical protein